MAFLLLLLSLSGQAPAPQTPEPTPDPKLVRVFVQTEMEGEAGDLAGKRQSVEDLTSALGSKSRKKTLVLVSSAKDADVVIEVTERSVVTPKFVMGLGPRPGESGLLQGPTRTPLLRVELVSGGETLGFTNKNKPIESPKGWELAADDVADQIEKWAKAHGQEILKRRGSR